jgi:two-component system, cell cycle response regulator DivK
MNRDMLSRRLQRRGFELLIAADGEQGVSLAAAERPDLILMDMSLPVLDGWEARAGSRQRRTRSASPSLA